MPVVKQAYTEQLSKMAAMQHAQLNVKREVITARFVQDIMALLAQMTEARETENSTSSAGSYSAFVKMPQALKPAPMIF
ncbi:hypothetical protein FVE85_3817 [Porphyridium purpureum]|uniref:Uncharacterized protein n=1 Tax=Porphyridium purpureum TaxID=35688 RepID=A0A5J4YHE1_PORPP|nr:hypothetical protein FVE85_3817 [Porphyridium purpureum]|eukprot:POR8711..scf243_20